MFYLVYVSTYIQDPELIGRLSRIEHMISARQAIRLSVGHYCTFILARWF